MWSVNLKNQLTETPPSKERIQHQTSEDVSLSLEVKHICSCLRVTYKHTHTPTHTKMCIHTEFLLRWQSDRKSRRSWSSSFVLSWNLSLKIRSPCSPFLMVWDVRYTYVHSDGEISWRDSTSSSTWVLLERHEENKLVLSHSHASVSADSGEPKLFGSAEVSGHEQWISINMETPLVEQKFCVF